MGKKKSTNDFDKDLAKIAIRYAPMIFTEILELAREYNLNLSEIELAQHFKSVTEALDYIAKKHLGFSIKNKRKTSP